MTKITLFIATSLDGFIADKNGGVDWLPQPEEGGEDFGYKAFYDSIQCIVMGSKSYEQILSFGEWLWTDKATYVFTLRPLKIDRPEISLVKEDVRTFIQNLETKNPNQHIWLLGGAELIKSFAAYNLIDECIITIFPTILSEGIPLGLAYENYELVQTKECKGGAIQKVYRRKKQ